MPLVFTGLSTCSASLRSVSAISGNSAPSNAAPVVSNETVNISFPFRAYLVRGKRPANARRPKAFRLIFEYISALQDPDQFPRPLRCVYVLAALLVGNGLRHRSAGFAPVNHGSVPLDACPPFASHSERVARSVLHYRG